MVFWGDYTGQPMPYRGWNAVVASEQNGTKARLTATFNSLLEWLRDYMSVDTVTLLLPVADLQSLAVQATIALLGEQLSLYLAFILNREVLAFFLFLW
ncbi:hypothetical protein GNF10_21130 [Nostoc sp. UCD121]|uniref:hypothetical protein n=1 Tax=unclassified Nostoc TaxID=2593658 RepID=UPI001623BC5B|nr:MULTISPECIES: hypothetical protein [unclassified Nostoc]MBC1220043.1 hypothetical protein [Nostoc sp. UCD120]MBC1278398.1 hypothetical protein [Nostoc sp. UCD121]MBC1295309.1 hypothetical protein [Nostoc sp. UCD122]